MKPKISRGGPVSHWYWLFSLTAGCAVLMIAWQNRLTFPYPSNDDARFFLPSWYFAGTGSLNPGILNAPDGIFWVPDGFYLWMGTFLALFGRSIAVARAVCELTVAAAVSLFAVSFRTIACSSWMGALITLILITPPVIFAANTVRMESVLCLLFAIAIWLHTRRAYVAAGSILLLSVLFHPALALSFIAYTVTASSIRTENPPVVGRQSWQTLAGKLLLIVVLFALAAELWRVMLHLQLFQQHMSYQIARKNSMGRWKLLVKPQAMLFMFETAGLLAWLRSQKGKMYAGYKDLLPVAAATLGMQLYAVLGGEAAYDIYSLSLGPAIFLALGSRVWPSQPPSVPIPS
jgi:hypothetical protein